MNEFWRMLRAISSEYRNAFIVTGLSQSRQRFSVMYRTIDSLADGNMLEQKTILSVIDFLRKLGVAERVELERGTKRTRKEYALTAFGQRIRPYAAHGLVWASENGTSLRSVFGEANLEGTVGAAMRFPLLQNLDAEWRPLIGFYKPRAFGEGAFSLVTDLLVEQGLIEDAAFKLTVDGTYRAAGPVKEGRGTYFRRIAEEVRASPGISRDGLCERLGYARTVIEKGLSVLCADGTIERSHPPLTKRLVRATPKGLHVRDALVRPIAEYWKAGTGPVASSLERYVENPGAFIPAAFDAYLKASVVMNRVPFSSREEQIASVLATSPGTYAQLMGATGLKELTLRRYLWLLEKKGSIVSDGSRPKVYSLPHE